MSSSAAIPSISIAKPPVGPSYKPRSPEALRALEIVREANRGEHLVCYAFQSQTAEIGYWRRPLSGTSYFVTLGVGVSGDAALLDAASKVTSLQRQHSKRSAQQETSQRFEAWVCADCLDSAEAAGHFAGMNQYPADVAPHNCNHCDCTPVQLFSIYIEL